MRSISICATRLIILSGGCMSLKPLRGFSAQGRTAHSPSVADSRLVDNRPAEREGYDMAIGPVQLIVLGFSQPDFHGEIIAELERLRESDTIRVIDSMAVYKDADGELEVEHLSNLSTEEAVELGSKIGALIGLGIEGEDGVEAGA